MSKQKRKLKKNQVQVDGNVYNVGSSTYNQMYEDKFENGDVVWDNLLEEWVSVPKGMNDAWNERFKNQRVGKAQDKVRKGTGSVARPLLDAGLEMTGGAGAYRFAQDPLKNLQGTANILSYANLPGLAMHGLDYMQGKPFFNVTGEDLEGLGNTLDVAGLATLGATPLIKQGVKQGTKTLVRELTKNRMPNIPGTVNQAGFLDLFGLLKKSKFKNKESIEYVKNVTSDPRYAQKAKELDVKYSDTPIQERPVNNNSTLTNQQQTTGFNPFTQQLTKQQTGARRTQRNNFHRPSNMFESIQHGHLFEDAAGPFTKMSNYTQTPNYYDKIFTNFNFGDDYLKKLNKNVDELTPAEFKKFTKEQGVSGKFYHGIEDIQISPNNQKAIAHELKHKEHFNKKWEPTFPKKYTEEISKNFDKTNYPNEYTQYRLEPVEQEAWLSRDLKKSMVDKGYLKTPFDNIDEVTLDKFIKQDNEIFTPELLKRLNKPNFLKWVNEALPAATGVTTAGAMGSQLIPQEGIAPEQKSYGGKINNMKNKNNLPKLAFGAPQLFDLAANTLTNLTTYAVTDMIKAIREPEQEMRPTKMNTGFTMANGGTVGSKPKYVKVNGKRIKIDSPEYKEYYQQVMSDREKGIYYNSPIDAEVLVTANKMTKAEKKKAQEDRYNLLQTAVNVGNFDGLDNNGNYISYKEGKSGIDGALGNAVLDFINMGREDYVDGPLENVFEYLPLVGSGLSLDDYTVAKKDLKGENKEGTFNNGVDMLGILPIGKYGNLLNTPKYVEKAADALDLYGTANDLYKDNINPMLLPNQITPQVPEGYDMNQKLFDYQKNQPNNNNFAKDEQYEMGGMIKRADGSYSKRGLWDNIRANKGSGKKPTKQMLKQEKKINSEMAFGGMIDPSMYMQQMMYGSYAQGGQVPQNIPVEVEGGEAYELPNGEMGEFEGPSHDNGGIPVALPEQTKVYSKQLKVNGKTMADRKTKREANVAKLEKILSKNPSDKFIREALKRQQETATLEEQSDMAMQEQANQQQQMQQQPQQGMMQEQAMQQEQVMAGMMQDPAMMQQMGMMMYGGKLNKLANGGEPCNPGFVKDASGNCVWAGEAAYKNVVPAGEGDIYSNFGSYPDTYYKKVVDTNKLLDGDKNRGISFSYFNPKRKETTWTDIPQSHPAYNQLYTGLEDTNKHFKTGNYPSMGIIEGGLFGQPYTSTDPEVGSVSDPRYAMMGTQPKLDAKTKFPQADLSIKAPKLTETTKPNVTDTNPPFFTEEQFNQLTNPQVNPLDTREKKGGVNVTNTNPYDAMNSILGNTFQNIAQSKDPYINTKGGMIPNPLYNEQIGNKILFDLQEEEKEKKPNKFMNFLNEAANQTGDFFTGLFDKNGKPKKEKAKKGETKVDGDLPLTAGDRMGMAGTLFGGLAPMTTTMLNRMMTPKNQNFFREYGAEGLRAMQEAQSLSGINRDKQLADIKLGEEASRQRGRNSARGVNTLRAMDISSDIAANQAQNQAYNSYAQQMMQLLGQKGQMENQQDQMVMQGEYNRDLADRQDVDQFYTNLAENFASQSELMQKQGRDMNQAQYNKMILQMSPLFSKYGIGVEMRNGKVVMVKDGKTMDETTAQLTAQKIAEEEKKKTGTTTKAENNPATFNPLGLGNTPYFNPIFTDINIPIVTDKSLTKAATKRR